MKTVSRTGRLAELIVGEQADAKERTTALRLQAMAWRLLAVIATHDQAYAKSRTGWLFFMSMPYVNQPELERFIEEHRDMAERYGRLSGVFASEEGQ